MSHWFHENWFTGWIHYPILASSPIGKMYVCYAQFYRSGFWKKLWLKLKIWYYRRLMKNE